MLCKIWYVTFLNFTSDVTLRKQRLPRQHCPPSQHRSLWLDGAWHTGLLLTTHTVCSSLYRWSATASLGWVILSPQPGRPRQTPLTCSHKADICISCLKNKQVSGMWSLQDWLPANANHMLMNHSLTAMKLFLSSSKEEQPSWQKKPSHQA